MSSSYFTFLNFRKNIRINIFITIHYLKHFYLVGTPLIFAFLVLSGLRPVMAPRGHSSEAEESLTTGHAGRRQK